MVSSTVIYVFADWLDNNKGKHIGNLVAQQAKGKKSFSFEYNTEILETEKPFILDPDINWFSGKQYPKGKTNFGVFDDTMPDTWGRMLMKRRAALISKAASLKPPMLYDIDFLLGTFDETRMGGLRFKLELNGPFLGHDHNFPTPPWAKLRELQDAVKIIESDAKPNTYKKWLGVILAPGSSLGGARPKANIIDESKNLWIAKFPSKNDSFNKAAWEFLAYKLAIDSGIKMSESKLEKIGGPYHTFFTKRFDRVENTRIHFSSAMTMTSKNEQILKNETASYLDIAEFIHFNSCAPKQDLEELWRRIVFNVLISNTDDHLRNHGFLLLKEGWRLSPAYDINPSIDKDGLALNIDSNNNSLDIDLVKSVGEYFQLNTNQMDEIVLQIKTVTSKWNTLAKNIGISRNEIEMMAGAFL